MQIQPCRLGGVTGHRSVLIVRWRREWDSLPPNERCQNPQKNQPVTDARYSDRVPQTCTRDKRVSEPDAATESLEGDASSNAVQAFSGDDRTNCAPPRRGICAVRCRGNESAASEDSPEQKAKAIWPLQTVERRCLDLCAPCDSGHQLLDLIASQGWMTVNGSKAAVRGPASALTHGSVPLHS